MLGDIRMQAIILAAGRGRRLGDKRPKCLQRVGGTTLIEHQLSALREAGIRNVAVVVGFKMGEVRKVVRSAASCILNPRFGETNSLCSFLLARPFVCDDVVVLNSDVYAAPELVARLARANGDALLYDSSSGHEEEHMKVDIDGGALVEMSKQVAPERICGENVGMLRFSFGTADLVFEAGTGLVASDHGEQMYLAAAVSCVARHRTIRCLDVSGEPWIEIDYPDDLARARHEVCPMVVATARASRPLALGGLAAWGSGG